MSVIVPVHNVAGHVIACLESLQVQSLGDFECIVVDDGSTDGSGDIAAGFIAEDPRFTLIHQDNRGLSGARNTGLDAARGDFIAFVDSDDRVMPDYLMRLWRGLEDSGADWAACAMMSVFPDGRGFAHSAIHDAPDLSQHAAPRLYPLDDWGQVIRHFPSAWNKLYRRDLIGDTRFDEGTWFEDHGFYQRLALRSSRILHLPEPLYLQTRGRVGQITAADDDRVFEQFEVLRGLRDLMRARGKPGGEAAFATLASRLLFERSTALRDPARRARFARAARDFLTDEGLTYDPGREGHAWGLEMAGQLPLSVVLPWDGRNETALTSSLAALHNQPGPGFEILLTCPARHAATAERLLEGKGRVVTARGGFGALYNAGIAQAQALFVHILRPGDRPEPPALLEAVELMLREKADMAITGFTQDAPTGPKPHDGFADLRALPVSGVLPQGPQTGFVPHPALSAKLFRRAFLQEQGLQFASGPRGHWPVVLGAATLGRVVCLNWLAFHITPERASGQIWRDHARLRRTLPRAAADRLPQGWQRRMFARALRDAANAAKTRKDKALLALSALTTGLRFGHLGARRDPAGMDPSVGWGLGGLLDPLGWLRGTPFDPQAGGGTTDPIAPYIEAGKPRLVFPCTGTGGLRLRVDFHDHDYANLSLLGDAAHPLPFHISLRFRERLIVVNDMRRDGLWRAERQFPLPLTQAGGELVLVIEAPHLRILLDGTEIARLGHRSLRNRRGLRGLRRISSLVIEGGMRLVDAQPGLPGKALALDGRLQLAAALPRGAEPATVHLSVTAGDTSEALPVTMLRLPHLPEALSAALPGRLWDRVPKDGALCLQLASDRGAIGPETRLTRDDMARAIAAILARRPAPEDGGTVLPLLDHLHDPVIWQALPAQAQTHARTLARVYKLSESLPAGDPPPLPAGDADIAAIDMALARFSESQRMTPAADPLRVLDALSMPTRSAREGLLLALSEHFCREGQDTAGFVARAEGLTFTPSGNVWTDSAMVPFLLLSDHPEEALEVMQGLAPLTPDWVLTPPIAFALRHALDAPALDSDLRAGLIYAGMEFVRLRSADYWERAHCAELTHAFAALLCVSDRLPWYLRQDLEWFCLNHYALSRRFWTRLARDWPPGQPLPPRVALARDSFARLDLARAADDRPAIATALEALHRMGAVEVPRMRVDLLGPAGTAEDMPTVTALLDQPQMELSVLRHMAMPGAASVAKDVAALARDSLPDLLPELARAPLFERQQALAKAARACLNAPTETNQRALLAPLRLLMDARSGHIGIGIGLALLAALPNHDTSPLQEALARDIAALPPATRKALPQSPVIAATTPRLPATLARELGLPAPQSEPVLAENPLFDAIVVVFSCKPYLDTRIPALRAGWLSLLGDLGIPYVFVIGDGDGRQEGDIVHLDAPDDYEGLPQKTLAAVQWVRDNTPHAHMIKIDDDCFLNAPLFFESLSYRKFDYYGRKLTRVPGQMDRAWHQAKSTSDRGQHEIDRSPEPSSYADGGSGYALSRRAMEALLQAAQSPQGQRLIAASFMEDKLVGDLLALSGIAVSDEDYRTTVRRRSHRDAIPVASWQNGFLPTPDAPVMLAHLDTHLDQPEVLKGLHTPGLRPKKIWPSYQLPKLGYQTNALELVSHEDTCARAAAAEVALVACMRNEMFMLPVFLDHYRRLGVDSFLIADNGSDDGTLEYLAGQPDVALFSVDTDYNRSHYGVAWQQALMAAFRVGKWSLVADADELLVWQNPQEQSLPDLLRGEDFAQAEAARIFMLDMYPQGPLEKASFASGDPFAEAGFADRVPFLTRTPTWGPYTDRPCWTSALRHRLIPGSRPNLFVAQKLALLRYHPGMRLSAGLHFVGDARLSQRELIFAHFKYNADFRRKASAEVARGQHWGDAAEYRKYLALTSEGRSRVWEEGVSVPWFEAPFVAERLG
jgi:glycosyltransferase involved in cell wall biosynthesis